jgi:hypothetical protein
MSWATLDGLIMSKISEILKIPKGTFVCCTSTDADFMSATSVNIRDGDMNFALKKFNMGKARVCFNLENPVAPVIKLEEDVPENFLQRGNEVVFCR